MASEVDLLNQNEFPFLTFVGLNPYQDGLVQQVQSLVKESRLNPQSLTNGFILELWSLASPETNETPAKPRPVKITRRQFAEIVGCILFKWTSEEIS